MNKFFIAMSLVFAVGCTNQIQTPQATSQGLSGIIGGELVAEKAAISYGIVGIYDTEENYIKAKEH